MTDQATGAASAAPAAPAANTTVPDILELSAENSPKTPSTSAKSTADAKTSMSQAPAVVISEKKSGKIFWLITLLAVGCGAIYYFSQKKKKQAQIKSPENPAPQNNPPTFPPVEIY